ncbi:hypothetical protein TrST_g4003 [Triparma strigata]|uniref:Leucine-rich repeat domain-containing protein n=1 Tax=Triparma strigata TaxID=1606541 RepID=A0A9W7EDG2_9STRA|nr:hypothetical protein TrST_g4003 [Triparma strigata]
MEQVTKVVFLLNITKVGVSACAWAVNLVVVDIPEGITIIGDRSFFGCKSLKDIKFPKSLTSIDRFSFACCLSLEKVDLLHTKVNYIGDSAFERCTSLTEMKVPDSLQELGTCVFRDCYELVPPTSSYINVSNSNLVVAYLRCIQSDDADDADDADAAEDSGIEGDFSSFPALRSSQGTLRMWRFDSERSNATQYDEDKLAQIQAKVMEREAYRQSRKYDEADDVRVCLEMDYSVQVDDDSRIWYFEKS